MDIRSLAADHPDPPRFTPPMTRHEAQVSSHDGDGGYTADKLRRALEERGWTINDLAQVAGVRYRTAMDWVNGNHAPRPEVFPALLTALSELTPDDLRRPLPPMERARRQEERLLAELRRLRGEAVSDELA